MILVTGATGNIGRQVLRYLLFNDIKVRALVRAADAFNAGRSSLLEVAVGSFEDVASLDAAMVGISTVLLLGRDSPDQVALHNNVIQAAQRVGVKRIVKLSAFAASQQAPIGMMRRHAETEALLEKSGFELTYLRPHLYMQNLLESGAQVASEARLVAPMGTAAYALVDTRDVAEACARVLVEEGHGGRVYTLTGPGAVSYKTVAEQLTELLGHDISYHAAEPASYSQQLQRAGVPVWRADDLAHLADAYVAASKSHVTGDVEGLLERPPRNLFTFLHDHLSHFIG